MSSADETASTAVEWHSSIAGRFDAAYARSPRFPERLAVWSALIAACLPPGGSALDAGCGSGVLSLVAARRGARVLGFDASAEMIAIAERKRAEENADAVEFKVADLAGMARFGAGSYDLVLSSSVLEYVDDLEAALRAHAAMLKEGGVLLVSMPNGDSLYRLAERLAFLVSGWPRYLAYVQHVPRRAAFERRLREAGLTPFHSRTFAAAPVLGGALRALGQGAISDVMFVMAARRGPG